MKKVISLVLTAIMVFSLLPIMAAEDAFASPKLILTGGSYYYDGHPKTVEAEVTGETGWTIQYSYYSVTEKKTWTEEAPTITDPGTMVVYARALKGDDILSHEAEILEVVGDAPVGSTVKIIANGSVTKAPVYSSASASSTQIGELNAGEVCSLLSQEGNWFEVSNGVITGFVYFEHISITSRPYGEDSSSNISAVVIHAKGGTFLYDGKPHYVEAYLENGKGCVIEFSTDEGKTWSTDVPFLTDPGQMKIKVQASNGKKTKQLDHDIVLRVLANLPSGTSVKIIKHGSNATAPIRKTPATNGTKIGSVDAGTVVKYLGREGDWIKILHGSLEGYVYYWFVDLENLELKPTITAQPEDTWVYVDEYPVFKVTAQGEEPIAYQWEYYDTLSSSWKQISGETSDTYTFKAQATDDGKKVRCVVKDANGEVTSDEATLTVVTTAPILDPNYPADTGNVVGKVAVFTVVAVGAESYQWKYRKTSSDPWANVTDNATAQSAALMVTVTEENNGYEYQCIVTNTIDHSTSKSAKLSIVKETVKITTQAYADAKSYNEGDTATFKIDATGDALSFTWQRKLKGGQWEDCTGTGAKTKEFKPVLEWYDDGAQYRCVVRNALKPKGVNSKTIKLKVISDAPQIDSPTAPTTLTAPKGSKFEYSDLKIKAETGERKDVKLKYVWYYYNTTKGQWIKYSTKQALVIKKVADKHNGMKFQCLVYRNNSVAYATSPTFTINVP